MKIRTIEIAMLGVFALACGAGADQTELESEVDPSVELEAPIEVEGPIDVEALKAAPISADEMAILDEFLAESSLGEPSFEGRLVHWDDVWTTVDDLLLQAEGAHEAGLVEKAYTDHSGANPVSASTIEWFRPDTQRQHTAIIQDNVPQWFFDAFASVVAEYMAVQNNDCIATNTWVVMRQSAFAATPESTKAQTYEINVNHVPITAAGWPCGSVPNGPKACALFPSRQNVTVLSGGSFVNTSREALGPTLHFDSGTFTSSEVAKTKRVMRHEVGHTLGLAHQLPSNIQVPGTAGCGQCSSEFDSVMRAGGRDSFTNDDILTLKTLYMDGPNRANDECSYVHAFRSTTAFN